MSKKRKAKKAKQTNCIKRKEKIRRKKSGQKQKIYLEKFEKKLDISVTTVDAVTTVTILCGTTFSGIFFIIIYFTNMILSQTVITVITVTTVTTVANVAIVTNSTTDPTVTAITTLIVKYQMLLLYSSKGNFFTKS